MISIKLENKKAIMGIPTKFRQEISKNFKIGIGEAIQNLSNVMKKNVPVKTGKLRDSIIFNLEDGGKNNIARGVLKVGASYGIIIEEGVRARTIQTRNSRVLSDGKKFFGKSVNQPARQGSKFFTKSISETEGTSSTMLEKQLDNTLKNL